MNLNNHCLFCLEKISPYSISEGQNEDAGSSKKENSLTSAIPTFGKVCDYLRVEVSKRAQFKEPVNDSSTCETFLCFCCFELIEKLEKLHRQREEIEKKILEVTKAAHDVILLHEVGANLESMSRRFHDGSKDNDRVKTERGNREGLQKLKFVQLFQKLIKDAFAFANVAFSSSSVGTAVNNAETSNPPIKIETFDDDDLVEDTVEAGDDWQDYADCPQLAEPDANFQESPKISSVVVGKVDSPNNDTQGGGNEKTIPVTKDDKSSSPSNSKKRLRKRKSQDQDYKDPNAGKKRRKDRICNECGQVFGLVSELQAHRKTHLLVDPKDLNIPTKVLKLGTSKTGKQYYLRTCTVCQIGIRARGGELNGYMEHLLTHEDELSNSKNLPDSEIPQLHECHICNKIFHIKLNLDLHLLVIHQPPRSYVLNCDICGDKCRSREDLIAHIQSHGVQVYTCKSCAVSCSTLDNLLLHMYGHVFSKSLRCPLCDIPFGKSMKELHQHCAKEHPDHKKKFECPTCVDRSFIMASSLKVHLTSYHCMKTEDAHALVYSKNPEQTSSIPLPASREQLQINLVCPHCSTGRNYSTKKSLETHILRVHTKHGTQYKCDYEQCDKSFLYKAALEAHIAKDHTGLMYPCPHCSKTYKGAESLTAHMRIHTGEGLYTCEHCAKQFPRKNQLKVHMEVHMDEECLVCETCGFKGKSVRKLQKHLLSHKEKKIKCSICQQMFKRRDHLLSHMRIHTGERPYKCTICDKSFNRRDILKVHMKGVHRVTEEIAVMIADMAFKNIQD